MLVVCIFASALGALIMCLLVLRSGFSPIGVEAGRADQDLLITRLGHAMAGVCFATTAILCAILIARPAARPVTVATPAPASDPRVAERLTALDRDRQTVGEQVRGLATTMQTLREQVGTVGGGVQGMRARVDEAESRVARAESGLASAEAALKRLGDEIAQANARTRQVERSLTARPVTTPARETIVPPPASTPPAAPPRRAEVEKPQESASPPTTHAAVPAPVTVPSPPVTHAPPPAPVAATPSKPAKPAPAAAASGLKETPPANLTDKVKNDWSVIRKGFSTAGDDIADGFRQLGRRMNGGD